MIKILKENTIPHATINCQNCDSLLEYGNCDLYEDFDREDNYSYLTASYKKYYLKCPVCGCKISASWISKSTK